MADRSYSDLAVCRRLLEQARPCWGRIAAVLLLGLAATPLALLLPVPLKIAVDSVVGSSPPPAFVEAVLPGGVAGSDFWLLVAAVGLQVGLVLATQVLDLGDYVLSTHVGERLTLDFRARIFRHVQRLSFAFHDARGTSDSIYRIQWDAPSIQNVLIFGFIPLFSSVTMIAVMVVVTVQISGQLALVALAVSPLLYGLTQVYKTRMRGRYHAMKELETSALDVVQEVLTALRVVKAFGREESEQERFVRHSAESARARVRISFAEGLLGLATNLVTALGSAAVLFIGIRNVQAGALTLGTLLVVVSYLGQLYGPLSALSQKVGTLQGALASARRSLELLDEVPDVQEHPSARPLRRAAGAVTFDAVAFSYDGAASVLHDVSFTVEPGTRVGIAGRTGAGKSTLVSLLTRFYDPTAGRILLDGHDLREIRLADLREQFAIVLQEPVLFSTSLAENVAYARPEASMEEIVAAARAADIHDFIQALPDGYDTPVGERGLRLSGGERQRISLARAFLKDAPLLILDEPTSSVDIHTEARIMEAMERLMQGRTTFMIAHRLSTLAACDRIFEIEDGHLRESARLDTPAEAVSG